MCKTFQLIAWLAEALESNACMLTQDMGYWAVQGPPMSCTSVSIVPILYA
jgi:hypothetical protein